MSGIDAVAETILRGEAPPLDALMELATYIVFDGNAARWDQLTDGDAFDSLEHWVLAHLLRTLQPSIHSKVGE